MFDAATLNPTDVLAVLDAAVAQDAGAAGFAGSVAVGTRGAHRDRWWIARFTPCAVRRYATFLEPGVDAALLLAGTHQPEALVAGDRALLVRFFARYLSHTSLVSVRGAHGPLGEQPWSTSAK